MLKNVSGQKVGVQMVSASDGSAFTGSVTVAVTLDAGTQATGSVGSGACTHEGNGYHTYAPSQSETNGDLVAFTFTGSGAVPATIQIYTRAANLSASDIATQAGNALTSFGAATASGVTTAANGVPAAVLSAAASTPIAANLKKINDTSVTGDGTSGTPWGP